MYVGRRAARVVFATAFVWLGFASIVVAQTDQPAAAEHAGHDMSTMSRDASGTAWLPDTSPIYAVHLQRGPWTLMGHENVFLQYLHESSARGGDQFGSINWMMGMAGRNLGAGRLQFRGMFSVEPATIGGCGYPDLLASGEECDGEKIHDRQHPHDVFMEVAAEYDAPVTGGIRWQVYGGPAGEPALGPVAYPHRPSAMPNPLAPIAHHWLDSTHVSFGVVTGGVYGKRWKTEMSAFNGREPDEQRTSFDFGPLDSVSGRLWFLPTTRLAFQVSAGRLTEAEAADDEGTRADVTKTTASATYHVPVKTNGIWASTIAWGRNAEGHHATNALLLETAVTLADRDTWFGRFEVVDKTAHDLDVLLASEPFTVSKLQGGYTRYLPAWHGLKPGFGATMSVGFVPADLEAAYGGRSHLGAGVFLTLRPALSSVAGATTAAASHTMVPVATDPARLPCSTPVDASTASKTVYNGTTYYFCSDKDRDEFLKDPAMNIVMMPRP